MPRRHREGPEIPQVYLNVRACRDDPDKEEVEVDCSEFFLICGLCCPLHWVWMCLVFIFYIYPELPDFLRGDFWFSLIILVFAFGGAIGWFAIVGAANHKEIGVCHYKRLTKDAKERRKKNSSTTSKKSNKKSAKSPTLEVREVGPPVEIVEVWNRRYSWGMIVSMKPVTPPGKIAPRKVPSEPEPEGSTEPSEADIENQIPKTKTAPPGTVFKNMD